MPTYNELKRIEASKSFHEAAIKAGFIVSGKYLNAKTRVDLMCLNGHSVSISPSNIKKGRGCSYCSKKGKEQAEENFKLSAINRGFVVIGNYKEANKKVLMQCPDGHAVSISPSGFTSGRGCSACSRNNPRLSKEKLNKTLTLLKYSLLSNYVNNSSNVRIKCDKGHEFSMSPHNIKSGQRCSVCRGNNQTYAYIHCISKASPIAVKFGIATSHKGRLKTQRVNNKDVNIESVGVWEFESVSKCRSAETFVKRNVKRKVLDKSVMPDGWSETVLVSDIHLIISIYEKFGGVKIG